MYGMDGWMDGWEQSKVGFLILWGENEWGNKGRKGKER